MKINMAILANGAQVDNGLLNIGGGGWSHYSLPVFPGHVSGAIAGIVEVSDDERDIRSIIHVSARDAITKEALGLEASIVLSGPPGDGPLELPFAVPILFAVTEPTAVEFTVSSGGTKLTILPLAVKLVGGE